MAAEHYDLKSHATLKAAGPEALDGSDPAGWREGDIDDGETTLEDSGAGSFLDRFVPPLAPSGR